MTDADLIAAGAAEIQHKGPVELVLRPESAMMLAGLMQLALRHPDINAQAGVTRFAMTVLEHVREYFADCPAMLEMLRRGDMNGAEGGG